MTTKPSSSPTLNRRLLRPIILLVVILCLFFWRSFLPGVVHFSNDGPLGAISGDQMSLPDGFTGIWADLNYVGMNYGSFSPGPTMGLLLFLGPVGFAKFFPAAALLILGLGALFCFQQLRLSPLACVLGAVAAMLTTDFFSTACWGVASQPLAFGLNFFAIGLIVLAGREPRTFRRWAAVALAGFAVGLNVIEAADIGALFSMLVAVTVVVQNVAQTPDNARKGVVSGVMKVVVVALFAGFIAFQTVINLIGTNIQGVAGTEQDAQTKEQRWDWATQWSLPKKEALGVVVPGLFGYRMDTPNGGQYWGSIGQTPGWEQHHQGFPRFVGGGFYAGVSVLLVALWAALQSLRRKDLVFTPVQRRLLWFWMGVVVVSLLLAFGRHAPFYQLLYALPYFSTIRNPTKFMHLLTFALVIVFAYGVDGLWRQYLGAKVAGPVGAGHSFKSWWAKAGVFERRWVLGCGAALGAGLLGWLVYDSARPSLERYLVSVQFDASTAKAIAAFSIRQVGWSVLFFALSAGLLACFMRGVFAGARARWGGVLLGVLLVADLGRAILPWIVHWDYQYKYASNPVLDFLRDKPYEQRVAGLPFRAPPQLSLLEQVYRIEWTQHHFQYYNIQSLDIVQMSREPVDIKAFESALQFKGTPESLPLLTRRWQVTNTRYLLGPAGFLDVLNTQVDTGARRFRIANSFDLVPKPGVQNPDKLTDITAVVSTNGAYAVFEFTGALPRVKLYSRWQVSTNDQATLGQLASPGFDPAQTVLVAADLPDLPGTNQDAGTVEFVSYAPKRLVIKANVKAPAVLLLNDRYDPNWWVTVDGQPAPLLRCNFIMRGVALKPGAHTVEFAFLPPVKALYVTLAAIGFGLILGGFLLVTCRNGNPPPLETGGAQSPS